MFMDKGIQEGRNVLRKKQGRGLRTVVCGLREDVVKLSVSVIKE